MRQDEEVCLLDEGLGHSWRNNPDRKSKRKSWSSSVMMFSNVMLVSDRAYALKGLLKQGNGSEKVRRKTTSLLSSFKMFSSYWNIALLFLLALLRILCTATTHAFNLDVKSALIHQGPSQSQFGFSVALYVERNNSWLLVGAPLAQTLQTGVEKSGTVYRCSIDKSNACHQVPFDRSGSQTALNNATGVYEEAENKTLQWFGATLQSSGPNGVVVACAPRYVYFSSNFKKREPIGACYVARKSLTDFVKYSPCKTSEWGYHRQGSCQAGFSAAFSKDGRKLFIGAVGSWYWQGQVFIQDMLVRANLLSTNEQPPHYDDSYMGYSMAAGEFSGDDQVDVAVGVPRGNNLTGKVIVFNSALVPLCEIVGQQIASYFGYAIIVGDIDGDKFDDIIVSSPMYSNFETKDGQYETGRVYVVYQGKKSPKKFKEWDILDGQRNRARFGLSLASLGDINKDSYGDFAVGAPYDGDNGGGAVYIYHGSINKVNKKPSQIIYASDIHDNLKSFGYSLSGGLDLDNNEYTDVIVGAYSSDRVVFLRSRPIVLVTANLSIEPDKINLDDKQCRLFDGSPVACMTVSTCLEYVGDAVPINLDFEIEIILDSTMEAGARLFFLSNELSNKLPQGMNLSKGIEFCKNVHVYIKSDIRDKLTPITIEMRYKLLDSKSNEKVKPILNQYIPSTKKKQVNIQKNCGKDNICIPQLSITADSNQGKYVQGSKDKLELEVSINNSGEDSFETIFYLQIPLGVNYINIDRKYLAPDVHITCSGPKFNNSVLKCDVGNPLQANKIILFKVLLEPFYLNASDASFYNFSLSVNSTNPENASSLNDNDVQLKVPVVVETELIVSGISDIDPVFYNKSVKMPKDKVHEADIGPEIIHIYEVKNRGPSSILEAVVIILWPTYTLSNKHLLYLVEKPEVIGNGRCEDLPNINPLNLTVEHKPYLLNSGTVITMDINGPMNDDHNSSSNLTSTTHQYIPLTKERKRRQSENGFQNELSCGPTLCTQMHCQVYNMAQGQRVLFRIRSRLATETLDHYGFDNVTISSKLVTKATKLPYSVEADILGYKVHVVSTLVNPTDVDVIRKTIPWWIIASAVCTGVLVLGLLIIVLWRLGFFKRKRPLDEFEREPLNKTEKNGILELSDEAL